MTASKVATEEERVVLMYPGGEFVSIDTDSGGYPWPVVAALAHDFKTSTAALNYAKQFSYNRFTVHKLIISHHTVSLKDLLTKQEADELIKAVHLAYPGPYPHTDPSDKALELRALIKRVTE